MQKLEIKINNNFVNKKLENEGIDHAAQITKAKTGPKGVIF
jgi:hypothetical protein